MTKVIFGIVAGMTVLHAAAEASARMDGIGEAKVSVVQDGAGYNAWPMIETLGGKVVCAYSRGLAHAVSERGRNAYARTSLDGGRTWGPEICVAGDPALGEASEGSGPDGKGAMLLWVRRAGRGGTFHDVYRTTDGSVFKCIATPFLSPVPMQTMDIFVVPGTGLVSFWFAGNYHKEEGGHSWGTLISADNGLTWTQRTIEGDLAKSDWPTEISGVSLGNGRILALARSEGVGRQFQLVSEDGGATWRRSRTNIDDVRESTPTLIFDTATGLVSNYYYHRGARKLKRRVVDAASIFEHPDKWPAPEVFAEGHEERGHDAGNVKGVAFGDRHLLALYSGTRKDCSIFVVSVPAPKAP